MSPSPTSHVPGPTSGSPRPPGGARAATCDLRLETCDGRHRIFRLVLLASLSGCGYAAGGLYEHTSVRVRMMDNRTERRTHEFDLTQAVVRELQADGIRVNARDAAVELSGSIEEISQPIAVEGAQDVVVVGSLAFRLSIVLRDIASGKELRREERVESATFSSARAETQETARRQVFDRLARWVATRLERDW